MAVIAERRAAGSPGSSDAFLAWPGHAHLRFAAAVSLAVCAWFGAVFIGADWITAHHAVRVRIHLDWELGIPLVPEFLVAYMSIYLLFVIVPFVLRTRAEVVSVAIALAVTILIAGIGFLLVPASLAWAPHPDVGRWAPVLRLADWMNLTYDLVPSLHVAMSVVCIEAFARRARLGTTMALRCWGVLIAVSTVLTHQHHLLDALTGYALGLVVSRAANLDRAAGAHNQPGVTSPSHSAIPRRD